MRFMHMADAHLGYRQYHSDERARDFGRAFRQMCQRAIAERCELVLIAGDLFHSSAIDPRTFIQALRALRPLREDGVDVVAIAGTHDQARGSHGLSWLHALADLGYLRLLEIGIEDGEVSLAQAIYETGDLRVIGIPWVGRALPQVLDQVRDTLSVLPSEKFTVLMLHAGLEGEIPAFRAALTMENLAPLQPYVDYVALGHIHKPYGRGIPVDYGEPWLQNPGSLETVSIDEVQRKQRGAIIVTVEDGKAIDFDWAIPDRRPFVQLSWLVDLYKDPGALYRDIMDCMMSDLELGDTPQKAVVEFRLTGRLQFDRRALDMAVIERMLTELFNPIVCRIRDLTEADASEITIAADATRTEIEHQVVRELVARDAGRKEQADAWTTMTFKVMQMALARSAPAPIIEQVQSFQHGLRGASEIRKKERPC